MTATSPMIDTHGRRIDYVRLSVTDRCNLRCHYCMAEKMTFLPRRDLLSLEEITELARHLVARGVKHIRLTGGEPLVRRGFVDLVRELGGLLGSGLEELTLTTNGILLPDMAQDLRASGIARVNISLDTLDPVRFAEITRGGDLAATIAGIDAALAACMTVKINMVAMHGFNDREFTAMARWCGARGCDLSLIETMPLGEVESARADSYLPLAVARTALERELTLTPSSHRTSGPSRYVEVAETGQRIGFITPLSNNFCAACNRIRIAATGTVYGCLGHEQKVELRDIMRSGGTAALDKALDRLLAGKPKRHEFDITHSQPATARHMSVTGG